MKHMQRENWTRLAFIFATVVLAAPSAHAQDAGAASTGPEAIKRGASLYAINCAPCHGARLANPEWATDLRTFPRDERARFIDSVTHGKGGMPPWGDVLKPEEIQALWAYVVGGESK
jgi:mono/diheme cytochrome c family protein